MNILAIAAVFSPVPYVPPTPESLTGHEWFYDCTIVDEERLWSTLQFHTEGGRGYWDAERSAHRTPIRVIFDEDERGLFSGMEQRRTWGDSGFPPGQRWATFFGDDRAIFLQEITPKAHGGVVMNASLVVTVDYGARLERLVGFCDVRTREQQPLTPSETSEFLAQ